MTHRPTQQEVCRGKVAFRSRKLALSTLNYVRTHGHPRPGRDSLPVDVYKCPVCKGWHMTSQNRRAA